MNTRSIDPARQKLSGYLFRSPACQQADDLLQTFGRLPAYAIFPSLSLLLFSSVFFMFFFFRVSPSHTYTHTFYLPLFTIHVRGIQIYIYYNAFSKTIVVVRR